MTYIIVTKNQTIVGSPYKSYFSALKDASRIYGEDVKDWMRLNIRIEENRSYEA